MSHNPDPGSSKHMKAPSFLSKTHRSSSSNSQIGTSKKALKAGSKNGRINPQEDSDSDIDDNHVQSNSALPSFKTKSGEARSNQQIEQDAVDTIRNTSGAYDDEHISGSDDENMDQQYQREVARFVRRRSSSSTHDSLSSGEVKNVRFKTNVIEDDDYDDDEKSNGNSNYREARDNDDRSIASSSSSEGNKLDHFKQFFHRSSSQREHGMKNLKGDDDESDDEGGFLSKFLNNMTSTGGGLAPGFSVDSDSDKTPNQDQEKVGGQEALEDDIPMVDFKGAAENIVQAHSSLHPNHHKASGPDQSKEMLPDKLSDGETMYSSLSATPTDNSSFMAPAMEQYDFEQGSEDEEGDDYDPFIQTTAYVAPPTKVRGGVLGSLLKLYQNEDASSTYSQMSLDESSTAASEIPEEGEPQSATPKSSRLKLPKPADIKKLKNIPHSIHVRKSANPAEESKSDLPSFKNTRPKGKKSRIPRFKKKIAAEARITVHIADLLQRHRFILRMCKALMLYGAPTHRLEEYMIMTSRVLEIDGQFLYLPGCMIVSFGDATTRTSEVQLVRCGQGLNLWKLHQVHMIYKQVIHDTMSAAEGNVHIDRILQDKNLYPPWICVFLYGFCSAMVTPYAFGGAWINMAISFFMGSCVGTLQYIVSQRSNMYSNVFEVSSSIVVSFCGRAFGSIPNSQICFGSVTQGSLALILPGYIILCGSLELQSRNLVAGSVRMFYAIIYSLFLGFGITLGAALFGWMYKNASNEISCTYPISPWYRFLFVPAFTIGISLINQANWRQLPVMVIISCTGYVVTYWAGKHFQDSTEFTAALAAFVIGLMGNLYSRIWKGLAVSAMLPAIFVQVPSGVASQSSLLSGLQSANQLVNQNGTTTGSTDISSSMSFGITMIQVSIGITVGLFASTLFIYPFGKKKTGLFSL